MDLHFIEMYDGSVNMDGQSIQWDYDSHNDSYWKKVDRSARLPNRDEVWAYLSYHVVVLF